MTETCTYYIRCGAPDTLFVAWIDVPDEVKAKIPNGLPCDGGGVPGWWCSGCPWEVAPEIAVEDDYSCDF